MDDLFFTDPESSSGAMKIFKVILFDNADFFLRFNTFFSIFDFFFIIGLHFRFEWKFP